MGSLAPPLGTLFPIGKSDPSFHPKHFFQLSLEDGMNIHGSVLMIGRVALTVVMDVELHT